MAVISIKCSCGETISYEIDPESLKSEFERLGVVPILVPHEDHFVTVYVDSNLAVRSVERVVLVKDAESSVIVKAKSGEEDINALVGKIMQRNDPYKKFVAFMSQLLNEVTNPESLFSAGRIVGKYIWTKRREPILKMGVAFKLSADLLIKNEIMPAFEKIGKVDYLKGEATIVIKDAISPGFIVGMAQGILDGIQEYMKQQMNIKIEYIISGSTVILTLSEFEM